MRVGYEMVDGNEVRSAELAIIISYPTSANNSFIKNVHKISRVLPTLFFKTIAFQLVFNFEQTRTVTIIIWRAWYNGSYTMMAKPMRALELHYPIIQFLINMNESQNRNVFSTSSQP